MASGVNWVFLKKDDQSNLVWIEKKSSVAA